jgi:hypothetical protein
MPAKKKAKVKKTYQKPLSLYPLKFEDAVKKIVEAPPLKEKKKLGYSDSTTAPTAPAIR